MAKDGINKALRRIKPKERPLWLKGLQADINRNSQEKVLLLLNDESTQQPNAYGHFAKQHRLARQKTKVLQGIIEGSVLNEIAEHHAVSLNTVHSRLASRLLQTPKGFGEVVFLRDKTAK